MVLLIFVNYFIKLNLFFVGIGNINLELYVCVSVFIFELLLILNVIV